MLALSIYLELLILNKARNLSSSAASPCIAANNIVTGASKYIYKQETTFQLCAELYGRLTVIQ